MHHDASLDTEKNLSSSFEVQISRLYRLAETAADYNSKLVKKTVKTAHAAVCYSAAEANRPLGPSSQDSNTAGKKQ